MIHDNRVIKRIIETAGCTARDNLVMVELTINGHTIRIYPEYELPSKSHFEKMYEEEEEFEGVVI